MIDGRFGGCTLNLIKKGSEQSLSNALSKAYQKNFNKNITPITIEISDGVGLITNKNQ